MALTEDHLHGGPSTRVGEALALAALALARRFSAGASLWCVAPRWRPHARHVAVEFVHPVVVGKPALPAVCLDTADVVASLRSTVRSGDVVLLIGDADDMVIRDIVRRAPAWGVMSMWIGAGRRPPLGSVDHQLWVDDDSEAAVHDGRLVLQYHVLWELTHVCLEHPGLMAADPAAVRADAEPHCVTCSDEGRVGEVIEVESPTAYARTACGVEAVDISLVADVRVGDLLLIHAGSALAILDQTGLDR